MAQDDNPFTARWSSAGHTLCLGHWEIHYRDKPVTLPNDRRDQDMGTQGNFSWLYPDDDAYIEGTAFEDWVEQNADWLLLVFEQHKIPFSTQTIQWFYAAVNQADWRCASCGGCL